MARNAIIQQLYSKCQYEERDVKRSFSQDANTNVQTAISSDGGCY